MIAVIFWNLLFTGAVGGCIYLIGEAFGPPVLPEKPHDPPRFS